MRRCRLVFYRLRRNTRSCVQSCKSRHSTPTDDLSSYRPISNLSFISKTIERVVAARLLHHVDSHQLLPDCQSAYRRFHSTETAIAVVHNDLVVAADADHVSALVLLDLSSAFDTVDHQILLSVLQRRFGIDDAALRWFNSYLCDRSQTFSVNGLYSSTWPVSCSVPQGSVLGPWSSLCTQKR